MKHPRRIFSRNLSLFLSIERKLTYGDKLQIQFRNIYYWKHLSVCYFLKMTCGMRRVSTKVVLCASVSLVHGDPIHHDHNLDT